MDIFDIKTVRYYGNDVQPEVSMDNEGWSEGADLKVRTFHDRRTHRPKPLVVDDTVVDEDVSFVHRLSMRLSQPGFDWGVGCFGNLSKIVETGKNECEDLYWFDFMEIDTATDFFDAGLGWESDDAWIRFVRSTQKTEEPKSEEQLAQFHAYELEDMSGIERVQSRPHSSESDKFLAMLDDMESALGEGSEVRAAPTSVEYPRWVLLNFRDWIEEADFIEANVCSPSGSRYYNVSHTHN